ncbi:MAG: serine hydrolase domain-containing protein [Colwellia polaris]|jgi:beta-lactamase class C|uniref:serine hydrolase domain-containing protein n=1 Tax=Colwellia polaris TaxID=326537 RepID=UPI000A170DBA|nr:serine hydrolase domain-containing protein [Colwellia polaris]|tara:strand:- start:4460 stop:5641 length:1182 start_codon:yes stop_codon:yes gene_type:complete
MLFRFLSVIFILCSISNVNAAQYNSFKKKLSNSINTELNKFSVPGAAYVVVKGDKVIAIESFGYTDKTNKQKINENTVFRLASVSKPFAATIATMLSQEKKLNLSDPITKFLPNFALASKGAAEKIQLTHLLSHSTGLMPNAYDNLLHENWSMAKIISRFDRVTPICQPAKCYGYQNIAYGFLQPAIEAVTKRSYASLLQERVFTPLKMDNASVGIDVFLTKNNTAQPHILRKRVKTGKKTRAGKDIRRYVWRTVNVEPDYYKVAPAAGVNASITDLSKWLIANLGNNPEVLSPALLSELTTPRIKTKKDLRRRYWREHLTDAHYGYGWRIYQFAGHPIIYHSGWVAGYRADIGYSPTLDIGFAILINAESNVINKISSDFWTQAQQVFDNVD